jgi:dienelactone hydrolase
MKFSVVISTLLCFVNVSIGQIPKLVTFSAADQVVISADDYVVDKNATYIVLLHQARSSRGEYREIAPRFNKLNYNCLAVDLRSGNEGGGISNETAMRAKGLEKNAEYLDAIQDVIAAINFAYNKSKKPVILLGSSYSASLALIVGKDDAKVLAVMAFSPGEYFDNAMNVQKTIAGFTKPLFAASASDEASYLNEILSGVISSKKIIFSPPSGGKHGAKALTKLNKNSNDYWLNIINFLKSIKE